MLFPAAVPDTARLNAQEIRPKFAQSGQWFEFLFASYVTMKRGKVQGGQFGCRKNNQTHTKGVDALWAPTDLPQICRMLWVVSRIFLKHFHFF